MTALDAHAADNLAREDAADETRIEADQFQRVGMGDYLSPGEYLAAQAARVLRDRTADAVFRTRPMPARPGSADWMVEDWPQIRAVVLAAYDIDDAMTPERQDECLMRLRDAVKRARGTGLRAGRAVTL